MDKSTMTDIRGVPVQFPFEPYDLQKDYMNKVIECLQNESVAVLESPTGTGKTLCLLCSSLAWLQLKKAQLQIQRQNIELPSPSQRYDFLDEIKSELDETAGEIASGRLFLGVPTIIYASRTHSQLSQAMQELKRSAYSHMKASVLGSRDQLCIHPEVKAEPDRSGRLQMCRAKLQAKSCHYNNRVETNRTNPEVCNTPILDIEDMVKLGTKHSFCPYYMTKDLKNKSDIIFSPYNYLLDPVARKALGLMLDNSVIILDEGHNIEKVCEESASVEVKTTDLLLAITELDVIMKQISATPAGFDEPDKDINPDDVINFKEALLKFTDILQEIPLTVSNDGITSFSGEYIYGMLAKVNILRENYINLISLINTMVLYLVSQGTGPFARKGKGMQLFADFLTIAFADKASIEQIKHCYRVHIKQEETYGKRPGANNTWLPSKNGAANTNRILSFWCFSPGFGMKLIMDNKVKGLILTSGTLAPLKPLISELELTVPIRLENPHIVKQNQICVKILPVGPDGEPLNSSFQNRDNPKYVSSLGRAIVNLSRIIPSGLLIFFPSYPIMQKCQNAWQAEGIWTSITSQKAVFVEPRDKDAFNEAMAGYYAKIRDPSLKGAIFMAVCRGKVSEGLDFADANGRAVIITGLPYPPLKDPKIVLKRRYLDECNANDKEFLTGQDWYMLEATRAVNQAIGRVIRHRYDYGAILLLDERFTNFRIKAQMSKWLREHVQVVTKYGEVIRDLSRFFRKAQSELPVPEMKAPIKPLSATFETPQTYGVDEYLGTTDNPNGEVTLHPSKRDALEVLQNPPKKKKYHLIFTRANEETSVDKKASISEYCVMVKKELGVDIFKVFSNALKIYTESRDLDGFLKTVWPVVPPRLRYIFIGLYNYVRTIDHAAYKEFLKKNDLTIPEDF